MKFIVSQVLGHLHRSGRGRPAIPAGVVLALTAGPCLAVSTVTLRIGQLSTADVQVSGAKLTLDVPATSNSAPTVRAQLGRLQLPLPAGTFTDVDVLCSDPFVRKPKFECHAGTVAANGGPTGRIAMNAAASYDSASESLALQGSQFPVAGGFLRFALRYGPPAWSAEVQGNRLDLVELQKLTKSWLPDLRGMTASGHIRATVKASGKLESAGISAGSFLPQETHAVVESTDFNYTNPEGTVVGQDLAGSVVAEIRRVGRPAALTGDISLRGTKGQALARSVLLDFGRNPLYAQASARLSGANLTLSRIQLVQTDLLAAQGDAEVAFSGPVTIRRAHFDVPQLDAAAAYRSFLQLALATTDFGALKVGGRASGSIDITDDAPTRISAYVTNLSMADSTARLSLANTNGEVHWSSAGEAAPSKLSWSSSSAYGLIGGPVQLGFTTRGGDFMLEGNTRFPLFDGALVVHTLAIRRFGAPDAELDFDAHLEPISMPLLSRAFGWPILSGQLAGRIPGVTYRDRVLSVAGDLSANVFDGTIVGSRIRLSNPLGPWPRLDADVAARRLDLDLLTHTFSIGSISGRLDADIQGLELFNWSPVAFDARLQTTPGDRSEHLISARAITSISNVGGGGGNVAAALQSGFLKFFHEFHYDRLGIRCQLRDEVCLMSGVEPARSGYYLVKGRGLPRIDIIGNAGRVDWPQLVGQISASIHSQNIVVR